MKLNIYTIQNTLFEGEVEKLIAKTPMGEITVLDNHLPMVSTVTGPAITAIDKNGKKDIIKISSGIIEIKPESEVTILAS